MIDYRCSLIYTRLRDNYYGLDWTNKLVAAQWILTILSAICLSIVAIFYVFIRELRSNIIGKIILLLAITEAIELFITDQSSIMSDILAVISTDSNTFWFLAMVYETFVLLKY
jgi:hypothetical protein